MVDSSSPLHHLDAVERAGCGAHSAAITFFHRQSESASDNGAGAEVANDHVAAAIVAVGDVRSLDEPTSVASFLVIQEIAAAVVAAKADPFGDSTVLPPAKRPGNEPMFPRFTEDLLDLRAGDGMQPRTGRPRFAPGTEG
jgi:hypothetical protein